MQNDRQDSPAEAETQRGASRRAVVTGAGIAVLATALGGCATYGKPSGDQAAEPGTQPAPPGTGGTGGSGTNAGTTLGTTAEVPVGGGKIFTAEKVVVTQPAQGEFRGFSAVCTHQGCTVAKVEGGTINCPCHGSKYRIADGSVAGGPAPRPLPEAKITVTGDTITLG